MSENADDRTAHWEAGVSEARALAAFLSARLDDVEFHAREGIGWQTGSRYAGQPPAWVAYLRTAGGPDFALAQAAASRKILAIVAGTIEHGDSYDADTYLPLLRIMAEPYSGHPDYRPEWKP